jgi:hypothetical protein
MQGLTQATYINFFYRLAAVKGVHTDPADEVRLYPAACP